MRALPVSHSTLLESIVAIRDNRLTHRPVRGYHAPMRWFIQWLSRAASMSWPWRAGFILLLSIVSTSLLISTAAIFGVAAAFVPFAAFIGSLAAYAVCICRGGKLLVRANQGRRCALPLARIPGPAGAVRALQ